MGRYRSEPLQFDIDGLYIILTDLGYETLYHWGLYLAQSPSHGLIFHMINGPRTGGEWEYQSKTSNNVPYSKSLLVAVKIAVIEPSLQHALVDALAEVSVESPTNCRVWIQRALHDLNQLGFVSFHERIQEIEEEASDLAFKNKTRKEQSVEKSRGSDTC